jgi:hypothetical protein
MNSVIYYPHIFPPFDWLRVAALCWDKVYLPGANRFQGRLIPSDRRIASLEEELPGFIDYSVGFWHGLNEETAGEFKQWVSSRRAALTSESLKPDKQEIFRVLAMKFDLPLPTERGLLSWLVQEGLAKIVEPDPDEYTDEDGEWTEVGASEFEAATKVFLPKDIGFHYLSMAARRLAEQKKSDLVTTDPLFAETVVDREKSLGTRVATSVIQAYMPRDLDKIELRQIAGFRNEASVQRMVYQKEIQKLVADFEGDASEGSVEKFQRNIVELARMRIEATQKAYRNAKIELVTKAFGISLTPPALMSAIGSFLGVGLFVPAGIAAAIAIFGVEAFLRMQKARAERAASPWSYVLNLADLAG